MVYILCDNIIIKNYFLLKHNTIQIKLNSKILYLSINKNTGEINYPEEQGFNPILNTSIKKKIVNGLPKFSKRINDACNVKDWQTATENQLKKRNRIHENIALLCDILPINEAIRIGILKGSE